MSLLTFHFNFLDEALLITIKLYRQQVSTAVQDSSQYSSRYQKFCSVQGLGFSSEFQFL